MKSHGSWWVWTTLAVCAVTVLGAMTWLTRNVIRSERERARAESRADLQERLRLSLWRMDAAGTTIIVEEGQRPAGGGQSPAPDADSVVKMHFEISESGSLSSSQGEQFLPDLRKLLRDTSEGRAIFGSLVSKLESGGTSWSANLKDPAPPAPSGEMRKDKPSESDQAYYNEKERSARGKSVDSQINRGQASSLNNTGNFKPAQQLPPPAGKVLQDIGPPRPAWMGGELFLLRRVVWQGTAPTGGKTIEGTWIDVTKLKGQLLGGIADLLPAAKLTPSTVADGMVLASFPLRLNPGEKTKPQPIPKPILISLSAGWIAALLAIAAASLLVRGVMRLSERRASFVSAVTHELRTPLTTFRLYSDMLEAGAVKEEKRRDYLHVLSREADRLSHLVENVLAFSGIERGSARAAVRETTSKELIEPMRERFVTRLSAVDLSLEMNLEGAAAALPLKVDAAAVEHILFNLIDNAAKYASEGDPRTVSVGVENMPKGIGIRVRDHGPGIPLSERKRIFRAFHKSARDAAESRPGVGLGLALSRRLSRSLGGDLVCEDSVERGASFLVLLPVARGR